MVVPQALRIIRLRPGRRFCQIGRISHELGWKYQDIVQELEEKRKVKGKAFYEQKKASIKLKAQAAKNVESEIAQFDSALVALGH